MSESIDPAEGLVREAVAALLDAHDPKEEDPTAFFAAQFDAGLAKVDLPVGLGGLDAPVSLQRIVDMTLRGAGAKSAVVRNPIGVGMGLPTVQLHGTLRQLAHYARPCFTTEAIWCQLFSEPGSGSDLAGLATRAVRDGDEWVVCGQKVWTSLAHVASVGMLIARTDADVPKRDGLTFLLVDMSAPGIEVRPIKDMTGDTKFNEVFLTDVRVPDSDRIGAVGEGWAVARTTLRNERAVLAGAGGSGPETIGGSGIDRLIERVRAAEVPIDAGMRAELTKAWIRARVIKQTNQRMLASSPGRSPLDGSVTKLMQGLHNRALQDVAMGVAGMASQAWIPTEGADRTAYGFLRAQSNTIAGGTCDILRTAIGERLLGLPREHDSSDTTPWSKVSRNGTAL